MLVPIDRPIIDADNIAAAAGLTYLGSGFIIQHNGRAVTRVYTNAYRISDSTTPIAAGIKVGQILLIVLDGTSGTGVKIRDLGNCKLRGDWYGDTNESWLKVVWDGTYWIEVGRGFGSNTTSGKQAFSRGANNTVAGQYASTLGDTNTASGESSVAIGKEASLSLFAGFAHSAGKFSSAGDAQYSRYIANRLVIHSGAGWNTLYLDGTDDLLIIPADTVVNFRTMIVGKNDADTKRFAYNITGAIARDGSNNTAILGTPVVTAVYEADDTDFDAQAVADDTNEALLVQVRDATSGGDTLRWVAMIDIVSVTF